MEQNLHGQRPVWPPSSEVDSSLGIVNKIHYQQEQLKLASSSLTTVSNSAGSHEAESDTVISVSAITDNHRSHTLTALAQDQHSAVSSAMQHSYASDMYSLDANVHQPSLPAECKPEVPASVSRPATIQDMNLLSSEDPAATLQHLYSSVATLQQILARNAQFVSRSSNLSSPTIAIDSREKYPGVDSFQHDLSHYYAKDDNVQHDHSLSVHLPAIPTSNLLPQKTAEINEESQKYNSIPLLENDKDNSSSDGYMPMSPVAKPIKVQSSIASQSQLCGQEQSTTASQSQVCGQEIREDKGHRFLGLPFIEEAYNSHISDQSRQCYSSQSEHSTVPDTSSVGCEGTICQEDDEAVKHTVVGKEFVSVGCMTDKELSGDKTTGCFCEHRVDDDKQEQEFHKANKTHKQAQLCKYFTCGGCSSSFKSICCLHVHLKEHASGGSYHFDHVSQTAFPKYDTFCSYSQTDLVVETKEEPNIDRVAVKEKAKVQITIDRNNDCVIMTRRASKRQEEKEEQSLKYSQTVIKSGRKRKQDNPKPSKPLMYIVPLETKSKKTLRETKRKIKEKSIKTSKKVNESKTSHYDKTDANVKNNTDKDSVDIVETVEKETACSEEIVSGLNECEDLAASEIEDTCAISKPFKKRGRPRKTVSEITKPSNVKDMNRKSTMVKTKKNKSQSYHEISPEQAKISGDDASDVPDEFTTPDEVFAPAEQEVKVRVDEISEEIPDLKQRKIQKEKPDKYQICDICNLPVPRYKYVFHMRSHTGERPFICEICGKSFARSRFLTKHQITHQEVKPWKCELCPSQFCQKNEYKMHMRGHAGDRPFQCNVCEMKFLSKTSLHTHQANIHMGLTRFECEVCNRRFFKRSSLNVHQATHYEAKLKCSFCDRKFRDKTGLKRHERIHTGVKKFKCHVCSHAFIQSTPFWIHMEKRHSMSRVKVKEMLKEIKETNRRSGIKMEVNVLPADIDETALYKTEAENQAQEKSNKPSANNEFKSHYGLPKFQHLSIQPHLVEQYLDETAQPLTKYPAIKVPSLPNMNNNSESSNPQTDELFSQHIGSSEHDTSLILRHYGLHNSTPSQIPTVGGSLETSASSALNLTNSLPSLCSLPQNIQQALTLPATAPSNLQLHGFIGLNNLQQALDYTSSLPQPTSYTDISSERIVTPSE